MMIVNDTQKNFVASQFSEDNENVSILPYKFSLTLNQNDFFSLTFILHFHDHSFNSNAKYDEGAAAEGRKCGGSYGNVDGRGK